LKAAQNCGHHLRFGVDPCWRSILPIARPFANPTLWYYLLLATSTTTASLHQLSCLALVGEALRPPAPSSISALPEPLPAAPAKLIPSCSATSKQAAHGGNGQHNQQATAATTGTAGRTYHLLPIYVYTSYYPPPLLAANHCKKKPTTVARKHQPKL